MALALAICVLIGRGFFALGRDGLLPKAFAKTSRHDTPWFANLMVAVGGIGLVLLVFATNYGTTFGITGPDGKFVPFFPNDQFATFILSATIGSFAIELVYLILAVVAFGLVRKSGNKWWQYVIVAVAVATPILGFYGALNPDPHDGSNFNWVALYWTLGLLALALVWFVILLVTRRDQRRERGFPRRRASRRGTARRDARVRVGWRHHPALEGRDRARARLARRRHGGGRSPWASSAASRSRVKPSASARRPRAGSHSRTRAPTRSARSRTASSRAASSSAPVMPPSST